MTFGPPRAGFPIPAKDASHIHVTLFSFYIRPLFIKFHLMSPLTAWYPVVPVCLFKNSVFILCLFIFPLSVLFHLGYLGDFHLCLFSINLCPIILVHPLYWSICQLILFSFCFIFMAFLGTNIFSFYLVCCALKTFKQLKYLLTSQIKKQICPNQEMLLEIISCIWCS